MQPHATDSIKSFTQSSNDAEDGIWRNESSETYLASLDERQRLQENLIDGVRNVLVVLPSFGLAFDQEGIRQKVTLAYPKASVFFRTTSGKPFGVPSPEESDAIDLLIDLTGPGNRQGWFYARKLRKMARVAVGRNAGLFRKRIYDRVYDDKSIRAQLPADLLERERYVQKHVFALAGVAMMPQGDLTQDLGKVIALDLPLMK